MDRRQDALSRLVSWPVGRFVEPANGLNRLNGPTSSDAHWMGLALGLARRAEGSTSPNPPVGALVVRGGRLAGWGYHRRAGTAHAEAEALRRAGMKARGATLYVTLEPCNHTGRTPPCCDAVLAAGVRRVVIGARDPNPITNGRGMARLRREGIRVVSGVRRQEAEALIAPFRKAMKTGLPFVLAKAAQSLDGKIATVGGDSQWISSAAARRLGHGLRGRVDAIVVGIETVLADDPRLTVRHPGPTRAGAGGRPVKVILDSRLRIPLSARCLSSESPAPTLIATTVHRPAKAAALARRGATVLILPARRGRVPLRTLFRALVSSGLHSVLVEGGGEALAGALDERLVDRIVFFVAPVLIGGRAAPTSIGGRGARRLSGAVRLTDVRWTRVGLDLCVEGRVVYPRHQT